MDMLEIGRLVTAAVQIPHVKLGEPPIPRGASGRVMRIASDTGLVLVRWWIGGAEITTDLYVKGDEIEAIYVEKTT